MTFVAQPYERFVDDLLTALTGGLVREEHRFVGTGEAYSLAAPSVIEASVKVYGQRNEAYARFDPGIDYRYDGDLGAIVWLEQGKLPDEGSYFYVNYYPQDVQPRLTDRNPGSVTTTLAESFGREYAVLHQQMEAIYRSGFVDLASGSSLDHIAALLGLTRKDAKYASGEVLFIRSTPAPGDISIPAGTVVSTAQGQNFETTDRRTLRRGQLSVIAPVRAQVEGPAGRVEAGAIALINRTIFGIETVTNEAPTVFATEKETDDELRRRIKAALERAGKSTVDAIRYALIEDIPEVTETNVQVLEHPELPGVVEVRFGLEASDPDLVRRIEESIFNARPAGVRVTHNLPTRTPSDSARRTGANGASPERPLAGGTAVPATHLPPELVNAMPEGVLDLRVEVYLHLTERNLSAAQQEAIEDQVRDRVVQFINSVSMGSDVVYSKLLGLIVQPDEIADAILLMGAATGGELYQSSIAADGRKPRVEPANVFVGLTQETVYIDVKVLLEPRPDAASSPDRRAEVTPAARRAVEDAINRVLASSRGELTRAAIGAEIRGALTADVDLPPLQLVAGNAVALNAEFEETGRLLNNVDAVALAPNHAPVLRHLAVEVPGALDV